MRFVAKDPNFDGKIRASFEKQTIMQTLGAALKSVDPGRVTIELTSGSHLHQQHGFLHAGVLTTIADSACGYAALSLLPPDREVLSVEFKINLMAPAKGDRCVAVGLVERPGRTLTVCRGEVYVDDGASPVALMQATMISVDAATGRP